MNDEDEDSLYQLEWELASHDGRITGNYDDCAVIKKKNIYCETIRY